MTAEKLKAMSPDRRLLLWAGGEPRVIWSIAAAEEMERYSGRLVERDFPAREKDLQSHGDRRVA